MLVLFELRFMNLGVYDFNCARGNDTALEFFSFLGVGVGGGAI